MSAALQYPIQPVVSKELSLNGVCRYHIDGFTLVMDVEEIANNRNAGNTSGTLALEMWALAEPYQGGAFSGHQVAGCVIGEVKGQHRVRHFHHTQNLQTPGEGSWYLVMMLREWDCGTYVTRDWITFPETVKAHYRLTLSIDGMPAIVR